MSHLFAKLRSDLGRVNGLFCSDAVMGFDASRRRFGIWTCVWDPGLFNDGVVVEGDTHRIEAVDPGINDVVGDTVTLRVIRSWGTGRTPEAGSVIRQQLGSLLMRGCVRASWDDEGLRAERMAEMLRETETRRRGRSRGLSMWTARWLPVLLLGAGPQPW